MHENRKKCVFVVGSYQPSLLNFRKHLMIELKRRGYDVIAFAPYENEETTVKLLTLGISYVDLPLSRTGFNPLLDLHTAYFIWKKLKEYSPSYIISYTIKPVIYSTLAASFCSGIKKLAWITGLGYLATGQERFSKRILQKLIFALYRFSLRNLEYIAYQNEDDKQYFAEKKLLQSNTKQIITAGSGVNLEDYAKAPAVTSPIAFLLIARLIKAKGVAYFIEAAKELKKVYKDRVEFHLIGMLDQGNPDAISEKELKELHRQKIIHYLGFQADVRKCLAECSVFVLPTYYREGTPRTILEAMSMGKPVITTDTPGCKETVTSNSNGFLIPIHNLEVLIEKMTYFIDNTDEIIRMGNESYRVAVKKYDVNIVNRKLLDFMLV